MNPKDTKLNTIVSTFLSKIELNTKVTKKNPKRAASSCTHMPICVHVGTPPILLMSKNVKLVSVSYFNLKSNGKNCLYV